MRVGPDYSVLYAIIYTIRHNTIRSFHSNRLTQQEIPIDSRLLQAYISSDQKLIWGDASYCLGYWFVSRD